MGVIFSSGFALLSVLLLLGNLNVILSRRHKSSVSNDSHLKALTHVGTANGTSYFFEGVKSYTNWTEAFEFCNEAGMHLATITTPTQFALLTGTNNLPSASYFWLGAREARELRMLSWDTDRTPLSPAIFTGTLESDLGSDYIICGTIYKGLNWTAAIRYMHCSSEARALCQT